MSFDQKTQESNEPADATVFGGKGPDNATEPSNKKRLLVIVLLLALTLGIGVGVGVGVGVSVSRDSSTAEEKSEDTSFERGEPQKSDGSFIEVGCFETEASLDMHLLVNMGDDRAIQCSKLCITRFFGLVATDNSCRCYVDVPDQRLSIGSCLSVADTNISPEQRMELYFNVETSDLCSQDSTKTVRNFLVEEDDVPFGFDIVSNSFRSSPFQLYNDECGTNIYEVQTEVSEDGQSLQTSASDIRMFALSRRNERSSSLDTSASAEYKGLFFKAALDVSATFDTEQTNLFKSSGASFQDARVFASRGVKRLAEVKILDFENSRKFVTLSRPFGNSLRRYLQSDFSKDVAYSIIDKYGQFVLTRGIFGGYLELRTTMSNTEISSSFESEERAKSCFEASVSGEASGFGFRAKASATTSGCSEEELDRMRASRDQFGREATEQSVVGGRRDENSDDFVVRPEDATLLSTKDKYPAGDRDGVQFRLLSDFLAPDKISPLEVKRLQITEDQFGKIQIMLQEHILEYLQELSDFLGGCNCTSETLPFLDEDTDGSQVCRCYDPEANAGTVTVPVSNTFSKIGNRRTCAWDRCPSSGFHWPRLDEGCSCVNGLNTCFLAGPATTVVNFNEIVLAPLSGSGVYRIEAPEGSELALGRGGDTASGNTCFDDPLRGGFRIDLTNTGYQFTSNSKVTIAGWSPRMRVTADGNEVATVGANAMGATLDVEIPDGSVNIEVNCGGWGANCNSELFVVSV